METDAERETDGPDRPCGSTTAASSVQALLDAYRGLLEAAGDHAVRRVRLRRLAIGTDRFLVERMRLVLDTLERRYRLRASAALTEGDGEQRDRGRLRDFAASLPPPASRARTIWLAVAILLVAKVILGWLVPKGLTSFHDLTLEGDEPRVTTDGLQRALQSLASLDYTNAGSSVDLLFREGFLVTCCLLFSLCLAGYIVLRPFAGGLALARALCDPAAVERRLLRSSMVQRLAGSLDVRRREGEAFRELGLEPPDEPRFDLLVRALLPVAVLIAAAGLWKASLDGVLTGQYSSGTDADHVTTAVTTVERPHTLLVIAFCLACLAALQLGWLVFDYVQRGRVRSSLLAAHTRASAPPRDRRRRPVAALACAGLAALAAAAGFAGWAARAHKSPSVEVTLSTPIGAAMARDRQFTVDVACDDRCHLDNVALVASDFPYRVAPLAETRLDYDQLAVPASDAGSGDDGVRVRDRQRLHLTRTQAAWLGRRLRPELELGAGLLFTVARGDTCFSDYCSKQLTLAALFRDLSCPQTAVCVS